MTYKTLRLNIDERLYPQFIAVLRWFPTEQVLLQEEELTTLAEKNPLAALAGSWEGEELRRAPQELITRREEIE